MGLSLILALFLGWPLPALATRVGVASYYGAAFAGRTMASGARFDPAAMVAAHRDLPFGTVLRVVNLANRRQVVVRVMDRGPWIPGVMLDLSEGAAAHLAFIRQGRTKIRMDILSWGRRPYGP